MFFLKKNKTLMTKPPGLAVSMAREGHPPKTLFLRTQKLLFLFNS